MPARPACIRVHAVPEQKKLDVLLSGLAALGIAGELPETVTPRDLRAHHRDDSARRWSGHSSSRWWCARCRRRSTSRPTSATSVSRSTEYAHFTSPIRRYPDLVVHRALKAICDASDRSGRVYGVDELGPLGQDLSRLEKRADEADRYVDTFLKMQLPAGAARPDLRGAGDDRGRVRRLRTADRLRRRRAAASRIAARRRVRDGTAAATPGSAAAASGGSRSARASA